MAKSINGKKTPCRQIQPDVGECSGKASFLEDGFIELWEKFDRLDSTERYSDIIILLDVADAGRVYGVAKRTKAKNRSN